MYELQYALLPLTGENVNKELSQMEFNINFNINAEMCILFPKRYIILERPHYSSGRGKVLNPSSWIEATEVLAMTLRQLWISANWFLQKKVVISCSLSYWQRGKSTNRLLHPCSKRVNVTAICPSRTRDIQ